MDRIKAMQAFLAVARHKSFTQGARQLDLSTKVVSNYVRQLEENLGVQLLVRTTRKVTLTDTGLAYYDRAGPLLAQFDELESVVQERQATLAGPLRITAPTAFGSAELIAPLQTFQALHPDVEVTLTLADHHVNVVAEGIDLAIRFGELQDSTLMTRKLMDMPLVTYAAPEYLKSQGEPEHPDHLTDHNCLLQQSSAEPGQWHFDLDGQPHAVKVQGSFHSNSPRAIAHMAAGGLGIGMTPQYVAQPFIASGLLTILLAPYSKSSLPLHAVYPQTHHLVVRVRALIDHLVEAFSPAPAQPSSRLVHN